MIFDPAHAIRIAADSIDELRRPDVYRVLDTYGGAEREAVAAYITKPRPELAEEVDECLRDLAAE